MNLYDCKFKERSEFLMFRMGNGELKNRQYRLLNIHLAIKEHVGAYKERPLNEDLLLLGDLILHEEKTDATPWKTRNTDYPIHSARQEEEVAKNEVIGCLSEERSSNGRRKRSDYDNMIVNRKTKSRNAERRRKYNDFTKVQPVIIRHISEIL